MTSRSTNKTQEDKGLHAWNPGVQSAIPRKFLPLASLYRPENCFLSFAVMQDRADFTGLELEDLAIYRPERMAVHSLLIRITANLAVSDGEHYEDLGINFRQIATDLEQHYLTPLLPKICKDYETLRQSVDEKINARLERIFNPQPPPKIERKPTFWQKLFSKNLDPVVGYVDPKKHHNAELEALQQDSASAVLEHEQFCWRSLAKLLSSIATRHGRLVGEVSLLSEIATGSAMNVLASKRIGEIVEAGFTHAAIARGYQLLPSHEQPVVINIKGASASGKSTLRPKQHQLVERLELDWRDFALISPDIWRKYLLDYTSLDDAWRYAGSLSGQELRVVDHKLDLYMATRHRQKGAPHLLIDRFRFDSFQLNAQKKGEERLLTRFGDRIFMMFMVTPPEALVERAWNRGLDVGRFKPVDDLLDHCVEAYTGMPPLFFRWASRKDKETHYEFLDNSVAKGELPKTIAFGQSGHLTIFAVSAMMNVSRFARINILARDVEQLWPHGSDFRTEDCAFLKQCAEHLDEIKFADANSGRIYACLKVQKWQITDSALWQSALSDPNQAMAFEALGAPTNQETIECANIDPTMAPSIAFGPNTLGDWGHSANTS